MYYYTVFGLVIASEIVFPELRHASSARRIDITVQYGYLEQFSSMAPPDSRNCLVSENKLLIDIVDVAKYLVSCGTEIIVHPVRGAAEETIRLFLLGSAMGGILHQRGFLPIHGNAIVQDGKCLIFAGHSGKGKSTLAAAFARRGFQILSDDLCAIKLSDHTAPLVMPGYPRIRLWEDSLSWIKSTLSECAGECYTKGKFIVPMDAGYCHSPRPLKKIYLLRFQNSPFIKFQPLNRLDSIVSLKKYTYRRRMIKKMNLEKSHYNRCAQLVRQVPITRVVRPADFNLIDPLIGQILQRK